VTVYLKLQQPLLPLGLTIHPRLWSGFAGCEGAAELSLKGRDPSQRPQWSSDRRRPLDSEPPSRHRLVRREGPLFCGK